MEKITDTLTIRRDKEINKADGGWFKARWHFSFDSYYDPMNMGIGTLRVFNHDTLEPGAVWPMHPHRDVEGISYIPEGEFEHADNLGNGGVLTKHGVQRMTLGSGAYHSERNHSQTKPVQFIQMWIMPRKKGLTPGVEQKQFTANDLKNNLFEILRPHDEKGSGVSVYQLTHMYASLLDEGIEIKHEIRKGYAGYLYLISGEITLNGNVLNKGDAAKLGSLKLEIKAIKNSHLILVDTILH